MKKFILAAIITIAISSGLSAQTTPQTPASRGTNKNNPCYVDNNKNNVCDNYENRTKTFTGKGQGQGRRASNGMGNRQNCRNMPCRQGANTKTNS